MEFKKIKDADSEEFKRVWKIYEEAFPGDERRDLKTQEKVMGKKGYNFYAVIENKEIIGLFAEWDLGDFIFGEHAAIRKDLRNNGLGTKLFKDYLKKCGTKILVGEVEGSQEGEMAKRRIEFYKRLGILLNDYKYVQPPYGKDKNPIYLFLITYPREITKEEFSSIRDRIHKTVYGLKEPLIEF